VSVDLAAGQTHEIVFRLGVAGRRGADDASTLVHRYRGASAARSALEAIQAHWTHTLGAVQVDTPDPALDVLANGWLLYQTLACRLWARSGYYQSGGAFGFRDQLQDAMALVHAEPSLLREHLLLCAGRQFPGRRCPALVASALRPRGAHPVLRRLSLAPAGDLPLCAGHRGYRGAG
jgi:cyclic beta-1,2-glucan synthetase